jgi:hypothetical protein
MNYEQLGLIGIFIAGAIPWLEAIGVVPGGILIGLDPTAVVISAVAGNVITIFAFAYAGDKIRNWLKKRRAEKGKEGESPRFAKAQASFDKYGIYGMGLLGPILVGTQFAAAISVAAGVKPLKTSIIISVSTLLWSVAIAVGMVFFGLDQLVTPDWS